MAEPVDDVLDPRVRQHVQGDRVGYDVAQVAAARAELVHRAVGRVARQAFGEFRVDLVVERAQRGLIADAPGRPERRLPLRAVRSSVPSS